MIHADPVAEVLPPLRTIETDQRFDATAAWRGLSPALQEALGATALAVAMSWAAQAEAERAGGPAMMTPLYRAACRAESEAVAALMGLFGSSMPPELTRTRQGQFRVADLIGPVCRSCGCSQFDACPGGCGWAEPDLCTACAGSRHG